MEQELSDPKRIFVKNIPFLVGTDMHAVNKDFSVFDPDKSLLNTALTKTE